VFSVLGWAWVGSFRSKTQASPKWGLNIEIRRVLGGKSSGSKVVVGDSTSGLLPSIVKKSLENLHVSRDLEEYRKDISMGYW